MRRLKLFGNGSDKASSRRSGTGALLTLLMLPALLGVMGCFPVPVGNPERSSIDPNLSGIWIGKYSSYLLVLDPYDRRTWLASLIELKFDEMLEKKLKKLEKNAEEISAAITEAFVAGDLKAVKVSIHKSWLTNIKGTRLMTWEPKPLLLSMKYINSISDHEQSEAYWFVFRIRQKSPDELSLDMVNSDLDDFEEVKSRREAESFLRRNINNPKLFSGEENTLELKRLPQEHYDNVHAYLKALGINTLF